MTSQLSKKQAATDETRIKHGNRSVFDPCFIRGLTALILSLVLLSSAQGGKVKVWHHDRPEHFDKAQLKHAVVSNEGAVRLSKQLEPLAGLDAAHVWDIVEDKQGNLFVATGNEGKIFQITPQGKVSIACESQDTEVLCLALASDGTIYAGTGPKGRILKLGPDGKTQLLYQTPENYVWSLAIDPANQMIYAGTGSKGRIYRVTPDGKGSVFYSTKQEHIMCLTMDSRGMLYAGSARNGLVYRIDGNGKAFVLYDAPQAEVHHLLATPEGVYACTGSPGRSRGLGGPGGDRLASFSSSVPGVLTSNAKSKDSEKTSKVSKSSEVSTSTSSPSTSSSSEKEKSSGSHSASSPSSGENSIYRICSDGTVREVFREKALLRCLIQQNGKIMVGSGMEGRLFEIDEASKEHSEIARLDHGEIHCLLRRKDGSMVLGTGDPGKLYVLKDQFAGKATVISEMLDAKIISKWGALRWRADVPAGASLTVAVRSGNVAEPDETWSDWSAEEIHPRDAMVTAPTARFLQYRVTLQTTNPAVTPTLHGLSLRYMTTNQAPEVTAIEVPDLDAANLDNPKKIKLKWTAADPNDDELTYNLYVRKAGWKNWVRLEEDFDKKEYEWDTTTTPSGVYHFKVVASDRKDNSAEDALTGERMSGPFVVAHEPPTVTLKVAGIQEDQALIEATAADPFVRLISASFSLNGKKWVNIFPSDGLFDSKTESFRFKTESLKPGTYVLVMRVQDAAGNVGSGDVVFTVRENGP
jgi:hypothetical protein